MKVKLNSSASIFFDPKSGILVKKGKIVDLNSKQSGSQLVKDALRTGYLVVAKDEAKVEEKEKVSLLDAFKADVNAGLVNKKLAKKYSFDQIKEVAAALEIEIEAADTKDTILTAIVEELTASSEGEENNEEPRDVIPE